MNGNEQIKKIREVEDLFIRQKISVQEYRNRARALGCSEKEMDEFIRD